MVRNLYIALCGDPPAYHLAVLALHFNAVSNAIGFECGDESGAAPSEDV